MRRRTPRGASAGRSAAGFAVLAAFAAVAAACGTQAHLVDVAAPGSTTVPAGAPTTAVPAPTTPTTRPLPAIVDDGTVRAVVTPAGVVAAVLEARPQGGYVVVSPCANEVTVAKATPVRRVHVVLDPGHGGAPDPGAVGASGLTEASLNLAVAELAKAELEAKGVSVALTRTTNVFMSLAARARIATSLAPEAFVSIHHNAAPNRTAATPGTEVYYQTADEQRSKRLSGLIHEEVVAALATTGLTQWSWYDDAGVKVRRNDRGTDYYGILRNAAGVPTALAELSYLNATPAEEALLRTDQVRRLEASALARAIVRYLTTDDPGSGFTGPSRRLAEATGGGTTGCTDPPL